MLLKLDNVGTVIATRKLAVSGEYSVTVTIGKPEKYPEGKADYYCPYQITGLGSEKIRYSAGVDAVQALLLTLKSIGADLYTSEEYKNGSLEWFPGDENRELGFPVPEIIRDVLP